MPGLEGMRPNDVPEAHHVREELAALEARLMALIRPANPIVFNPAAPDPAPTPVPEPVPVSDEPPTA